ncbi:protein SON-like [Brachionichthys hirsutus]|uniref:protein SON-like n=1 Tax=Brachionichthys hirsutus TaxID=412623 RepID=UPI003604C8F8
MATDLEQIFKDFILNKIRQIEDQNEDNAAADGVVAVTEKGAEEAASDGGRQPDLRACDSRKKRKKHKKKKKKRNREKEKEKESTSEGEGGAKHRLRREEPAKGTLHRGKRRKKKKRKKYEDHSSDSNSEFMSKQGERKRDQSASPRRQEELPDIIPKQEQVWKPGVVEVTLSVEVTESPTWKPCSSSNSSQRISELDKDQLLEIAKANAAAMCVRAGMPVPAGLRSAALPVALPALAMNAAMASMTAATMTAALSNMGALSSLISLPSIANKPPPLPTSGLEEMKRRVLKQANSISIKEFTDKCKMIVDSKGELPVAMPHVSDDDDEKPFGGRALREQKAISFSINNTTVRPTPQSDAGMAKEFPVSSGSQHRKKEGDAPGFYGEWVPVEKSSDAVSAASRQAVPVLTGTSSSCKTATAASLSEGFEQPAPENDSVFPDPLVQPVDISQALCERIKAQKRLAENPCDVDAICLLSRAQEQVDAWAQSSTIPGLFTGSTGAQVLSSEELSTGGPQAWLKKDQFLRAAPVSGGVGEFLMRKMGWRMGEGLGRNREGTVEPIVIDFKVDRKGLVAEGEKPQKQTGGLVVTKDLMGKHPVSALIELCNKRRIMQPDFVMVHHGGPDHRKNFLFKVTVEGLDYQPQTASPNKKHAKAMAATVALQALGEVPADGPGLYTGPVFTAASTGPLFST